MNTDFPSRVVVLLSLALLSLAACDSSRDDRQLVIGVIADRTGFMSGHGESIELGARLAADALNETGGVLGREVAVVVVDGASDPATSALRARELAERRKVDLVIGTGTSAASLSALAVTSQAGVPFIYSLDGECKTCQPGETSLNPLVFGSGFTERMVVRPLLQYLVEQSGKTPSTFRIYLTGGDYVYPRTTNDYTRAVAISMGLTIVAEEYSDTSTEDYSPVIRRIIAAAPDLLIVTNPGASGVKFMRQAQQFGLHNITTISGFATFDQEAIASMGNASEGVYCINRYSNLLDNESNVAFVQRFREAHPNKDFLPGPTAAAGAYGAMLMAARAYVAAGSTEPHRFSAAMSGLEMDLPQGHVRVNPVNNIFEQHIYLMRIKNQQYTIVADMGTQVHPGFEGCSVK
jgi:ABC-type branched-subunit amino acid transport system substrate-binding protein